MNAARKAGGKIAQDVLGISETGGMKYFTLENPLCVGSIGLLREVMEAANTPVDDSSGDRRGGAENLGKCLVTSNDEHVVIMVYVPKELESTLGLEEWSRAIVADLDAQVVERTVDTVTYVATKNPHANLFPLKMKDQAISQSLQLLRRKDLVVDDDKDDYDFGKMYDENGIEW